MTQEEIEKINTRRRRTEMVYNSAQEKEQAQKQIIKEAKQNEPTDSIDHKQGNSIFM
jgi:hypothetical protein